MKKQLCILITVLTLIAGNAFAHTALMSCFDEGDGTITCEGGFSDGSSASGVKFFLMQNDATILSVKFTEYSEVNFKKPVGDYQAVFNAGEGHMVYVDGNDIIE
ncbi:MAG: hypothetical protein JRG71_07915 [Deltaproteobacteria bacterium]|nr:hypothetical protein [Deltaproteobacteria bacterium]